jgi:hypothetical protein
MISGRFSKLKRSHSFGVRELAGSVLALLGCIALLHFVCLRLYPKSELDIYDLSDFYPLSVFRFRKPSWPELALALATEALFVGLWRGLSSRRASLAVLFCASLLLAVSSNLLHGWRYGIDYPTATSGDSGIEYYHDAVLIQGPLWLLARFNAIQFQLLEHARTHPPGPVLLYYVLYRTVRDPGLVSIGITAVSLALALPKLRRLLTLAFGEEPPGALLLYAILPANLIYGLATVDAPIAALFLAAAVSFVDDARPGSWCSAGVWLSACLFFTFGALFLVPVFIGFEWLRRKRSSRCLLTFSVAALLLTLLKPLFGYGWLASFVKAATIENANGFLLFTEPKRYLWYRLGAIAEIAFFFSPFLVLALCRGWAALRRASQDAAALAWIGPACLSLMLLSGAMKIGEAARICLFILPYLLLPVLAWFREASDASRFRVAQAVFAWGVVMQLFGFYQW